MAYDTKPNAGYICNGIKISNVEELHRQGYLGEGMRVGVIDSGCYIEHEFIKENIVGGKSFITANDKNFIDRNNHGTFCIGEIVQIAPKCEVIVAKALNKKGNSAYLTITKAFEYCVEQGCHVISMSLGGDKDYEKLHQVIKKANELGIIIICASGNDGDGNPETSEYHYPASYEEVVNVGAVNQDLSVATYSNTNEWVDICAVGTNVESCYLNNKWCKSTGTSMATPIVSGICLLLREKFIKENGRTPSEQELYEKLLENTIDLGFDKRIQGHGFVYIKEE